MSKETSIKEKNTSDLSRRDLLVSRSPGAPEVAARIVNARRQQTRRRCRRARAFCDLAVCGRDADARRQDLVERRGKAVELLEIDAGPGGPRGVRRGQLWQRRNANRPRTAPKMTPKRRKIWGFTSRATDVSMRCSKSGTISPLHVQSSRIHTTFYLRIIKSWRPRKTSCRAGGKVEYS